MNREETVGYILDLLPDDLRTDLIRKALELAFTKGEAFGMKTANDAIEAALSK